MVEDFIELFELQHHVRDGLESLFPERVWVRAEISSLQARTNGHCYLELSQSGEDGLVAKAKAIIWRSAYPMLSAFFKEATGEALRAGITLLFRVQVNYSELYGLSLIVDDIDPQYTLGEAELSRRRTVGMLKREDLLDRQKEVPLSALPYRLAVISARDAAGYGDFCRHLAANEFGFVFGVDLFEAQMQGETAPSSIMNALSSVGNQYDAVLILRGGGSALDLACFDDFDLCRAIALFPLPVFTAIGHDRDVHVADIVAYQAVKTPTALADLFISAFAAEDERISAMESRLSLAFARAFSTAEGRLDTLGFRIDRAVLGMVAIEDIRINRIQERIAGADPRSVLSRGYSLVVGSDGRIVKKVSRLCVDDRIKLYFSDGEAEAVITEVKGNGR